MSSAVSAPAKIMLANLDDIPLGEGRLVLLENGRRIALFNTVRGVFAIDDVCPHKHGPLSDGIVAGGRVSCPLHNATVCLCNGKTPDDDELPDVKTYPLHIEGNTVFLADGYDEIDA